MWLRHVTTGKVAPIDWYPAPGGNILIHGETYEVLVGSERDAMDPTSQDIDAQPKLRYNHQSTCTSARGRGTTDATPTAVQYAEWERPAVDGKTLSTGEHPDDDDLLDPEPDCR
jgi:hypothetical protein